VNHTISMARPDYPLPAATMNTNAGVQAPAPVVPDVMRPAGNPPAADTTMKMKGTN